MGEAPRSWLDTRCIDDYRPLRVVVIGAGISGILASIRLPQRIPNLSLQIYEKNADIGGTWFENRYPGCACDIPAHTYQATFEPNHEWSQFYATSKEIHGYWRKVVEKYDCMKHIKLNHQIVKAVWDNRQGKWQLEVKNLKDGSTFTDTCDVVLSATGALNDWKWPSIPGLEDFKGTILHSASWDESFDWTGKRLAVIGNGSSGIQIVPAVLAESAHVDHYIRGRTWLSPTFAREKVDQMGKGLDNFSFTPEDIQRFKTDPDFYTKFRKDIELELQSVHGATIKGSPEQMAAVEIFTENMKRRLAGKPELGDTLLPSFPPVCRRLTPGPGYLEALTDAKTDVITTAIEKVDATGIITTDGQHHPVDAIICATGFDTSFSPRFPVIGKNNTNLVDKWGKVPSTYLSLATDDFPNYYISLGPNSALGTGNLLLLIERVIDYVTMCLGKMQRDNIRSMAPRQEAVETFVKFCDEYFQTTVFSQDCRSWYKGGTSDGRVSALWPGSSLHSTEALANPRWEDFVYEYVDDNAGAWIGNGWTVNEREKKVNVDYLNRDQIDFPPVPELAVSAALKRADGGGNDRKVAVSAP
ncbi:cyclohexanone monooxygenase [Exophiala viscosa]|uniref:Cyclohexanone monooxygenase n=1 Tax=Exophiala viscosa TaxID=2486360 RepID=A0AAN6IFF2_9EURO|nr:cyclohexanone monooxygenase [Exophiala viscosa]